jgi:hypothetical protein
MICTFGPINLGMTARISKFLAVIVVAVLGSACTTSKAPARPLLESRAGNQTMILMLVKELPMGASEAVLKDRIPEILQTVAGSPAGEISSVREGLALRALQPASVKVLIHTYNSTPSERFSERFLLIQVLGALKRPDAFAFLKEVIWKPLPTGATLHAGLSTREREEIIQSKAMQGLAYLGTASAAEETMRIIREHGSEHVRREAIDAYLWNQGDSAEAVRQLRESLPARYHTSIGMPRYMKGGNAVTFNRKMDEQRRLSGEVKP